VLRATVADGNGLGSPYTKDFTVTSTGSGGKNYFYACINRALVTATGETAGGILDGWRFGTGYIIACYNAGDVISMGGTDVGQILGKTDNSSDLYIADCYY
jgi:hypothetical protein